MPRSIRKRKKLMSQVGIDDEMKAAILADDPHGRSRPGPWARALLGMVLRQRRDRRAAANGAGHVAPVPAPPQAPAPGEPVRPPRTEVVKRDWHSVRTGNGWWSISVDRKRIADQSLANGQQVFWILLDPDGVKHFRVEYRPEILEKDYHVGNRQTLYWLKAEDLAAEGTPGVERLYAGASR
jgi:hypothetical protein